MSTQNRRAILMPRHPKLIKGGWTVAPEMAQVPKVVSINCGLRSINFTFPDHFVWCRVELGPLPVIAENIP